MPSLTPYFLIASPLPSDHTTTPELPAVPPDPVPISSAHCPLVLPFSSIPIPGSSFSPPALPNIPSIPVWEHTAAPRQRYPLSWPLCPGRLGSRLSAAGYFQILCFSFYLSFLFPLFSSFSLFCPLFCPLFVPPRSHNTPGASFAQHKQGAFAPQAHLSHWPVCLVIFSCDFLPCLCHSANTSHHPLCTGMVWFSVLLCAARDWNSTILMGPLQLEILFDSVIIFLPSAAVNSGNPIWSLCFSHALVLPDQCQIFSSVGAHLPQGHRQDQVRWKRKDGLRVY